MALENDVALAFKQIDQYGLALVTRISRAADARQT